MFLAFGPSLWAPGYARQERRARAPLPEHRLTLLAFLTWGHMLRLPETLILPPLCLNLFLSRKYPLVFLWPSILPALRDLLNGDSFPLDS